MTFNSTAAWRSSGLCIMCERIEDQGYGSRLLRIEDLSPQVVTQNVVTRWELFRIGAWMIWRALRSYKQAE